MTPPTSKPLARASEHLAAGRVAEAAGAYRATLQIDPSEPQAHAGLGHCAFLRAQYKEAYDHFVQAAALWREREDSVAALGCYTHAVGCDPSQLDVHVEIAELEAELGHIDAARQRLEGLAENYLASGRHDDAVAILEFVNQWEESPPAAPEVPAVPTVMAPEPADITGQRTLAPEIVRDADHTMVISTFLLTPDGSPFIPSAATPHVAPQVQAISSPIQVDDDGDATATRRAPVEPDAFDDAAVSTLAEQGMTDDELPFDGEPETTDQMGVGELLAEEDLSRVELAPDLFGSESLEEREATTVRPIPIAAMPPRQPAPPSRDAEGRTLAERLRTTRARAAAPTAPHPTTRAVTTKPTTPSKPTAVAKPTTPSKPTTPAKPTAVAKPTTAAKPTTPATPSRPTPVAPPIGRPTTAAKPAATAPRATTPARATSTPTKPTPTRPNASPSRPATAPMRAATPAPSRPQQAAAPRAATPTRATAPKPTPTKPTAAASPRPATRASAPAKPTAPAKPSGARPAAAPQARSDKRNAEPNKRVMAVRTRTPAPTPTPPGVPQAVGPSRTLPLVIPPPPAEEQLDDSRTVLYRGQD